MVAKALLKGLDKLVCDVINIIHEIILLVLLYLKSCYL